MPDNSSDRQLKKLAPKIPELGHLLLFWLLAIGLPFLAILVLLNSSEYNKLEQLQSSVSDKMFDNMGALLRQCSSESYFKNSVTQAETAAGLPPRHANLVIEKLAANEIHKNLAGEFSRLGGLKLITIISGNQDLSDIEIHHDSIDFADYPKPGQWAARTLLKAIIARMQNQPTDQMLSAVEQRMLRNFNDSIFGNYFNPVVSNEDFNSGFIVRNKGTNLHTVRRIVFNNKKEVVFSYLAIFAETARIFDEAWLKTSLQAASSEFELDFVLKTAIAFPFLVKNKNSSLSLYAPISYGKLNAGAHASGNLIDRLTAQGELTRRPAHYPHLKLTSRPLRQMIGNRYFYARMLVFLFLCLTLLALKHFQQTGMLNLRIRLRLFAAVFLATVLPATAFMFSVYRHNRQQTILRQTALIKEMKTRLKLLELNLRSQDEIINQKAYNLVDELSQNIDKPDQVIESILSRHAKGSFVGAMLIKNNGLSIEIVDRNAATLRNNPEHLNFSRDIYFASMIKFFDFLGLILDQFYARLESTPNGRKLKALSTIFTTEDVENFCSYEGSAQTTKKDSATLRFISFKIIPHGNRKGANAAVLLLVQDIREVVEQILAEQLSSWSFYEQTCDEGRIRNTLTGTHDLDASSLDLTRIWPPGQQFDENQKSLLEEITNGKAEVSRIITGADSPYVAMVAAKIGGYPLIAVSQCSMNGLNADNSQTDLFLLASFAYLMLILIMLVSLLDELFATPIKTLLQAVKLTENGCEANITNDFTNELAALTGEFNIMNRNLKERERLTRFISKDAAQTISRESREMSDIPPARENRSILFIHIRGFSELSEKLNPESLIALLNQFFPFAEAAINDNGGQIDKYIADAIMAVFADRADGHPAALMACQAADKIRSNISTLNAILAAQDLPGVILGIGIASGEVIAGKIGAQTGRRDYTVIGDRVNLAARLESMSHFSERTRILVDQQTKQSAVATFSFKDYGELPVKGKTSLVQVYELIANR